MMKNLTESDVEVLESESVFDDFDLFIDDNWYDKNPDKVLGVSYITSGRFGKVTKYSGGVEVLSRIEAETDFIGAEKSFNNPMASVSKDMNISAEMMKPEVKDIVATAIESANTEIQRLKKKKVKEIDEDSAITPKAELNDFFTTFSNLNPEISIQEVEVHTWYKTHIGKPLSKYYVKLFKPDMFEGETERQLRKTYDYNVSEDKVNQWVSEGLLFYYKGKLYPKYEYQSGNMYDKQLELAREKDYIVSKYGDEVYQNQENALRDAFTQVYDKRLLVGGQNGLVILANSRFAKEFFVETIELLPEDKKFKIRKVTASSNKDYGKPDFLKDLQTYRDYDRDEFEKLNLTDAFTYWMFKTTPPLKEAITHQDIYKYYIQMSPIRIASADDSPESKKKAEAQKEKLKSSTQKEGERLFNEFLETQITSKDKIRLETEWNMTFNNYLPINLNKIPVAFTMAKYVFGQEEKVRAEKRDAVAFNMSNGTGVLSYDVGVGKTPSAIFTISAFLDAGYCKRPLIVVPNQVYKQFISEIKVFAPHIPINEAYNLGEEYIENFKNAKGNVSKTEEGTVTIITYEGFENIGFNDETRADLLTTLYDILNQGGEDQKAKSEKQKASFLERVESVVGKGLKGGMYPVEDFGFDFICYDEAHKMKKVFTSVKGESETDSKGTTSRGKNPYVITSGSPSSIGLKGFMINYYILKSNNYKNILLLTATPFTNSPLEIFSMLSMVAYETLRGSSLDNLKTFFDTYVKTSTELVINTKLKPEFKQVILGFNNLVSLQSLIRRYILYKTGDDVNIVRPKKYVLPYQRELENGIYVDLPEDRRVDTFLSMTPQQGQMMNEIITYVEGKGTLSMSSASIEDDEVKDEDESGISSEGVEIDEEDLGSDEEKRGVRTIKGLSYSRNLALSPYLYEFSGLGKPDYKKYVESSPKLKYVMDCIKSVKEYCESKGQIVAGQVIYMDRGIEYFTLLKQYLVSEVGFRDDEIGIIKSGLPKTGVRSKEYVKNLFNGEIYNEKTKNFETVDDYKRLKVVIGSSTIKEGMNLQKYGAVLYNCFIDWNPTDIQQLEGRIYRQKNTYSAVRIVNPLVIDSADIFLFQKLMEKTARLNSIWSSDGKTNVLNTDEFNPDELKYALIRDPNVIAELKIIEERSKIDSEIIGIKRQESIVDLIKQASYTITDNFNDILEGIEDYRDFQKTGDLLTDATKIVSVVNDLEKKQTDKQGRKIIPFWERKYKKPEELVDISDIDRNYSKPWRFSDFSVAVRDMNKYIKDFIKGYGISFKLENYLESLKPFEDGIKASLEELNKKKDNLNSPEVKKMFVEQAMEEKERQKIQYKPLPRLVSDFSKLNYLLERQVINNPKKEVSITTCPPIKKDNNELDISDEAIKRMDVCLQNEPQTKSLHFDKERGYTEERQKLHNKIIDELFEDVKCVRSNQQPIAIFTGGSPASGKSTFLKKNAKYLLNDNIFKLDADEIRSKLPEYKGWNANSTHLETSDIVNDILNRIGSENCRYDFIYDGTMNKAKKYFPLIKKVKELGYKVYIIFMDIPYAEAKKRALERYQRSGRYVPMEVIDDFFTEVNGKTKGKSALDELKPLADGYVVADGITSKITEEGGEGIPDTRSPKVYSKEPVKLIPEANQEEIDRQQILDYINALEILAEMGDEEAKNSIEAYKYLI